MRRLKQMLDPDDLLDPAAAFSERALADDLRALRK